MIGQMERTGDWTEGEWRVVRGVNDISVVDIDRTVIAEIAGRGPVNTNEPLANARLIARAPALHAFAESFMAMANDVTSRGASARPTVAQLNALFEQARAALAQPTT